MYPILTNVGEQRKISKISNGESFEKFQEGDLVQIICSRRGITFYFQNFQTSNFIDGEYFTLYACPPYEILSYLFSEGQIMKHNCKLKCSLPIIDLRCSSYTQVYIAMKKNYQSHDILFQFEMDILKVARPSASYSLKNELVLHSLTCQ